MELKSFYQEEMSPLLEESEPEESYTVAPQRPVVARRRRRQPQLSAFSFRMGPVALCTTCVLLIGLMAVLYLSQLGQSVAANQRLQDIHNEQAVLRRQDQDLMLRIAQEQSPLYIAEQAKKMGLVPSDPKNVQIIIIHDLKPLSKNDQNFQP